MVSARIQFPQIDIGNTYGDFYSPLDIVSFNTTSAPYHFQFPALGKAKYSVIVFSSPVKSSFFTSKRGNWQPQPV